MKTKPRMFRYESASGYRWVVTDTDTIGMGSSMENAWDDYRKQKTSEWRWSLVLLVVTAIVLGVTVHGMQ